MPHGAVPRGSYASAGTLKAAHGRAMTSTTLDESERASSDQRSQQSGQSSATACVASLPRRRLVLKTLSQAAPCSERQPGGRSCLGSAQGGCLGGGMDMACLGIPGGAAAGTAWAARLRGTWGVVLGKRRGRPPAPCTNQLHAISLCMPACWPQGLFQSAGWSGQPAAAGLATGWLHGLHPLANDTCRQPCHLTCRVACRTSQIFSSWSTYNFQVPASLHHGQPDAPFPPSCWPRRQLGGCGPRAAEQPGLLQRSRGGMLLDLPARRLC